MASGVVEAVPPPEGKVLYNLNLALIIIGGILCYVPLFMYGYAWRNGESVGYYEFLAASNRTMPFTFADDDYQLTATTKQGKFMLTNIIYLGIAIPSGLDLFIDMFGKVVAVSNNIAKRQNTPSSEVIRMTCTERLLFILGTALAGIWVLFPIYDPFMLTASVYFIGSNASFVWSFGSVLLFLMRCSHLHGLNKWVLGAVNLLVVVSSVLWSVFASIIQPSSEFDMWYRVYCVLLYLAFSLYLVGWLYATLRIVASFGRRRFPTCFNWSIAPSPSPDSKQQTFSEFDRFGNATTIHGHLLSNAISAAVTMYWISTPTLSSMTLEMNCYITGLMVFANALPLVVEMRIRQNEAAVALMKMLESKKHYVRFISHELRTPLNAAMIGLTMAIDSFTAGTDGDTVDTAELGDTLNDVLHAVSTGVDILNDLLSFEKIDSGLLELHREDVPVKEFVKHCISLFEAQAKGLGVTIVVQDPSVAPRRDSFRSVDGASLAGRAFRTVSGQKCPLVDTDVLSVDKFKMAQVVRNLISNSLKFTPKSGKITVTPAFEPVTRDGGKWRGTFSLSVADSGAGISEENQQRLFKEVVQFNPEKLQGGGGSGFGLFICKKIVSIHGGDITVFSEGEGCGTTFTITLPMSRSQSMVEGVFTPVRNLLQRMKSLEPAPSVRSLAFSRAPPSHSQPAGPLSPVGLGGGRDRLAREGSNLSRAWRRGSDASAQVGGGPVREGSNIGPRATPASPLRERPGQVDISSPEPDKSAVLRPACAAAAAEGVDGASAPAAGRKEALIVDDSLINLKVMTKMLSRAGFACETAHNGSEAVDKVRGKHANRAVYDVILMDFFMPEMNGPDAVKEIRALGYQGTVLGLTGNALQADKDTFMHAGANAVLIKPTELRDILGAMRETAE